MDLKDHVRSIPDFPKPGIVFLDITTLLLEPEALKAAVDALAEPFRHDAIDKVVAAEARGFILGVPVAMLLGVGFVPVRKPGKLPAETVSESYELEYGTDAVEMHADAFGPGAKVLMIDDLLATGGTMTAACKLVEKLGGRIVGIAFVIELCFLHGRDKLPGYDVRSLIKVEN